MQPILNAISTAGLDIMDRVDFPRRDAILAPPPATLHPDVLASLLARRPQGIYRHQARALELVLRGDSVVLSTATASGKSLVFMAAAAHHILSEPGTKTLVLYPAKALIDDQFDRWREEVGSLGVVAERIHGGVPVASRQALLHRAHVILMTPDVAHAWLLRDKLTQPFLRSLRLLVLDEAHQYEGAFGTHMAYLLRRLRATSRIRQVIATTATLGTPDRHIQTLTGLPVHHIGKDEDGAPSPGRAVLRVQPVGDEAFTCKIKLARALRDDSGSRFLAFLDSRRSVAQVVIALERLDKAKDEDDGELQHLIDGHKVLPYRAGYEESDRTAIQNALRHGQLSGVVSTSALELGLDIGDMDVVALMTSPPTMKSFGCRSSRSTPNPRKIQHLSSKSRRHEGPSTVHSGRHTSYPMEAPREQILQQASGS